MHHNLLAHYLPVLLGANGCSECNEVLRRQLLFIHYTKKLYFIVFSPPIHFHQPTRSPADFTDHIHLIAFMWNLWLVAIWTCIYWMAQLRQSWLNIGLELSLLGWWSVLSCLTSPLIPFGWLRLAGFKVEAPVCCRFWIKVAVISEPISRPFHSAGSSAEFSELSHMASQ